MGRSESPQAEGTTDHTPPFTLGFKAWQSDKDVSEIAYSYRLCDTNVDLVHLVTIVDWRKYSY